MPSLPQIAEVYAPLLLLDAASSRIQLGVIGSKGAHRWQTVADEAGTGVFTCLEKLKFSPDDARGFIFCEGPGSILGIRTVAAALRSWLVLRRRPVWAYKSLELIAAALSDPEILVVSDARRESWHVAQLDRGCIRIPSTQIPEGRALVTPEGFRHWSKLPDLAQTKVVPYDLAELLSKVTDADLFHPCEEPDAFLHEEPFYALWTPQIHRAPH